MLLPCYPCCMTGLPRRHFDYLPDMVCCRVGKDLVVALTNQPALSYSPDRSFRVTETLACPLRCFSWALFVYESSSFSRLFPVFQDHTGVTKRSPPGRIRLYAPGSDTPRCILAASSSHHYFFSVTSLPSLGSSIADAASRDPPVSSGG